MPAPKGNKNAAKGKLWEAAIKRALESRSRVESKQALDELAAKLIDLCLAGNLQALIELGNRLDGKPHQSMDVAYTETPTEEMDDAELERIAAGGRRRASKAAKGTSKPSSVH